MKTQFNITSMKWDLERYTSVEDFATALEGFDGVELMDYGDDISPIIPEEKVIGIHMQLSVSLACFLERRYGTVYPGIWIRKTGIRKFLAEQTARHWWMHFCRIGTVRCFIRQSMRYTTFLMLPAWNV